MSLCRSHSCPNIREKFTKRHGVNTHMSCLYTGPREGSYKPPRLGLFKSSRRTGFVICLTEIRRTSSVVRTEKDTLWTVEGIGSEIFMSSNATALRRCSLAVHNFQPSARCAVQGSTFVNASTRQTIAIHHACITVLQYNKLTPI